MARPWNGQDVQLVPRAECLVPSARRPAEPPPPRWRLSQLRLRTQVLTGTTDVSSVAWAAHGPSMERAGRPFSQ